MMLYLFAMAWWLSHCTYWLVCVGFLYTVVARLPSLWGVTKVSKKGIDPSALGVSAVNLMFGSIELICWRNSSWCCSWMTKVASNQYKKNNVLAIIQNYIILYNVLQTPSKVGVLHRIIFSHTPDEARSGGLVKACVPRRNCSVPEKLEFLTLLFIIPVINNYHTCS